MHGYLVGRDEYQNRDDWFRTRHAGNAIAEFRALPWYRRWWWLLWH